MLANACNKSLVFIFSKHAVVAEIYINRAVAVVKYPINQARKFYTDTFARNWFLSEQRAPADLCEKMQSLQFIWSGGGLPVQMDLAKTVELDHDATLSSTGQLVMLEYTALNEKLERWKMEDVVTAPAL